MRLILILVISFCVSACVIDWAFNATFFYLAAVASVFHRLMHEQELEIYYEYESRRETEDVVDEDLEKETRRLGYSPVQLEEDEEDFGNSYKLPFWVKLKWFDYVAIGVGVVGFLRLWKYAIEVEF